MIEFFRIFLRGAGQVMFQGNAITGALFLLGIFWGALASGIPEMAWGAVLGVMTSTAAAYALKAPDSDIKQGLHGYNGILVGCALPLLLEPGLVMWVLVLGGSFFTTVLMLAASRFLKTWKISAMTGPFVLITWLLMLSAYNFGHFKISGLPYPAMTVQPGLSVASGLSVAEFFQASLTGVSQVFLINNMITGALFLAGLAASSISAAVFAWCGSMVAIGVALFVGADSGDIVKGLFQFSAVLTAIGLGTTFYKGRAVVYAVAGIIFTVVAQGALNVLLAPFGIPALTFPFIMAAWIFLLPNIDLLPLSHQPEREKEPGLCPKLC